MKQNLPLAIAYLSYAIIGLLLVAETMPPFQNADELNHAYRADQISHFGLLPEKLPDGEQGGGIDAGLMAAAKPFSAIPFHPGTKVVRAMYAPVGWGARGVAGFPNTAIYPPVFYVPAALAIAAARLVHLNVLQGLALARLAGGMVSVAIGAIALFLCEGGALWLFAILLLPMSIALNAAISQDGPMLACAALAAALVSRLKRQADLPRFGAAVLLLAVVAASRPPYAAFAAVLLSTRMAWPARIGGVLAVFIVTLLWCSVVSRHVVLPAFAQGRADPRAQLMGLVHGPWHIFSLIGNTWYAHGALVRLSFIGWLGWLDTELPDYYHALAWCILGLAGFVCAMGCRWGAPCLNSYMAAAGVGAAAAGVALIQYLTWTVPGAAMIGGLQGRYFLPVAIMGACLLPVQTAERNPVRVLAWPVLLFPVLTLPVIVHALILRYLL